MQKHWGEAVGLDRNWFGQQLKCEKQILCKVTITNLEEAGLTKTRKWNSLITAINVVHVGK